MGVPMHRRLAAATCVGVALLVAVAGAADRYVVETVLVRVNDRILTMTDFQRRLEVELSQIPEPPTGTELETFARNLFDSVVDEMILLERATEKRLRIEESQVDTAINNLREQNNLQDDAAFEEALRSAGLDEEALRARFRQSMLLQRTAQSEVTPTEITEQELLQLYEEQKEERYRVPPMVELQQLFFPIAADSSDRAEVLQRARGLIDRVRSGSDLRAEATLAGIEVQELGAIPEQDLRPDLKRTIDGMEENEITDPLETGGGVQVIRLLDRRPASYQPFEEVKDAIRREVSMSAYEQQTRAVVERLKGEYLVEINEQRFDEMLRDMVGAV
jgi:parvulin-like peptidyl-prolyl isomerase